MDIIVKEVFLIKKPNVISLNQKNENKEDILARLTVDDDSLDLDSFILSGVNKEGKRCVLTWNCDIDELASYLVILDSVVKDKIKESMNEIPNE